MDDDEPHEELSEDLEHEVKRMQDESEHVKEDIDSTRKHWDAEAPASAPGKAAGGGDQDEFTGA